MRIWPSLNPDKGIDVWKYGLCLKDPTKTHSLPDVILKGQQATLRNCITYISDTHWNKRSLEKLEISTPHPLLSNYNMINHRLRFLRGFSSEALAGLGRIWERMGEKGVTHQRFPASVGLLMDPDILTAAAFERQADKEKVPQFRDGAAGHELQKQMVQDLEHRYFDFDYWTQSDPKCFLNGKTWVAFSRLMPFVQTHIDKVKAGGAGEIAEIRERELWRGEYDKDFLLLSSCLPDTISDLSARVYEQFDPIRSLVVAAMETDITPCKAPALSPDEQVAELTAQAVMERVEVGNVADHMPGFSKMSTGEKVDLAQKLSRKEKDDNDRHIMQQCMTQVLALWRIRVRVFETADQVKHFSESSSPNVTTRIAVFDVTANPEGQAASGSRNICRAPAQSFLTAAASKVKTLPCSPIVGTVIMRHGNHNIEALHDELDTPFPYRRHLLIPIALPAAVKKFVNSAVSRALGPIDDNLSGIEMHMRITGRRSKYTRTNNLSTPMVTVDDEDSDEQPEAASGEEEEELKDIQEPSTMSRKQLKKAFGEENAEDIASIIFNHTARMSAPADHLPKKQQFHMKQNPRAPERPYRKSEVSPSVWYRAFQNAISGSNAKVNDSEAVTVVTGGII